MFNRKDVDHKDCLLRSVADRGGVDYRKGISINSRSLSIFFKKRLENFFERLY